MTSGRKHKGGTSILKRLAGGNGDKTKVAERRMPKGSNAPTERGQYQHVHKEERERTVTGQHQPRYPMQTPPPRTGRYQRSRMYRGEEAGREQRPKRESKAHRERVEEHKKKHPHKLEEGEHWIL